MILFSDGSIQEGDTLSPTDIEANLSTEVSLTVLDVLELFVNHHKVSNYFIVYKLIKPHTLTTVALAVKLEIFALYCI